MFNIALVLNIIRSILKVNIAPRLHMISLYRVHSATGIVVHWWLAFIKESSGLSTKELDMHQFIEARIALWASWVVQTVITQNSRLQVFIWTIMMISSAFLQKSSLLRAPCQATFHSRGARKTAYAKYLPFHCWLIPDIPVTGRRLSIIIKKKKQAPKWDFGTITSPSPLRMRRFIWWTADLAKVGVLTPWLSGGQIIEYKRKSIEKVKLFDIWMALHSFVNSSNHAYQSQQLSSEYFYLVCFGTRVPNMGCCYSWPICLPQEES